MSYHLLSYEELFFKLCKNLWYAHRYHLSNESNNEQFYQNLCIELAEVMIQKDKKQFAKEVFPYLPTFMDIDLAELIHA